ncbi:hypothetical protein [Deinococcus navajonensis]|uniref:Uncharacterized protein n=1 Tax=Deinococcus navajonensis TaxID=309884 RepID=A0ABV8XNY2_9DEIO
MNVTRHFSDTRTDKGRVRFLVHPGRVSLVAETEGWQHHSTHTSLDEAAIFLATLPEVPGPLYERALNDLEQARLFGRSAA